MDAEAVQTLIQGDRKEWEALVAALEAHPKGPLHDPESPEWTSRDVYAHLARWMERSTEGLQSWLASRTILPPVEGTDDEINARWQEQDSAVSLDEARERAQRAFDGLHQAIEAVPLDRWDGVVEAIAHADGAEHYANHRKYVVAS